MKLFTPLLLCTVVFISAGCGGRAVKNNTAGEPADMVAAHREPEKKFSRADIVMEKDFLYDQHTLADTFPYKDTVRIFQFDKMRECLFLLDSIQLEPSRWAVLQNRQNKNGEAPLVKKWERNEYKNVSDMYGVQRYQSVPLYLPGDSVPERYGRDGALVKLIRENADSTVYRLEAYDVAGHWESPAKYVRLLSDTTVFRKAVMVDRTNQNIATVEKVGDKWLIRSMNPATTGVHNPPYAHETPEGMFVVQEKKPKMLYTHDGSSSLAGFAPWASRFSNGGYLHGVPTNDPNGAIIEYSWTLGTTPRSHMCVRNASSHAKFIYDWGPTEGTIVFVYD